MRGEGCESDPVLTPVPLTVGGARPCLVLYVGRG